MKKLFIFFGWLAILISLSSVTSLASIDNLSNMSAEWIRTGNRNAATDAADITVYNPAGVTCLKDGLHINFSNQTLIRQPSHSFNLNLPGGGGNESLEQDGIDWLLPNLYGVYKKKNWAIFGGIYIPGGGAVANYTDGSINTKFIGSLTVLSSNGALQSFRNDWLEASSYYIASTIGGAYAFNDSISVAVGLRHITAKNEISSGMIFTDAAGGDHHYKLETEETANGFGGTLGFNLKPHEKINIGLRYETRIELDFETEVNRNDFPQEFQLAVDNAKNRRDFPASFGLGVAYDVNPKLKLEYDYTYYFQDDADWGKNEAGEDLSDLAGETWSMGVTAAYQHTPKLLLSVGAIYTYFNWNNIDNYYQTLGAFEVLYWNNWNFGTGFAYQINPKIKFNFGISWTIWEDKTIDFKRGENLGLGRATVNTENSSGTIAFGIDVAFE